MFNCCSLSEFGRRFTVRFFLFSLAWIVLTGADGPSWILGGPAVLAAVLVSLLLSSSPSSMSIVGAVRFIPFFVGQSWLSGIDVMRRALSPRLLINPGLITYKTSLPAGPPLVFFVNAISLLPGTLSADLEGSLVTVHTIDVEMPTWASMEKLEFRVALLFRQSLLKREKR